MKIGEYVTNNYHNIIRYGKIIGSVDKKDGWRYFDIDWKDDEVYIKAISNRKCITDKDHSLRLYRADQIQKFDLNKTIQTLLKLQISAE
jgi:hypothetical protein